MYETQIIAGFEYDWPPERREAAWSEEVGRRTSRQLRWLVPALAGVALALLVVDAVAGSPGPIVLSRLWLLGGCGVAVALRRRGRPIDGLRMLALALMCAAVSVIAFVVSEGRRPEPYLALGMASLVVAPIGTRWSALAAGVLTVGSIAVAPAGIGVGYFVNSVIFPLVAVLARRFVEGLDRGAFEARLRVEWARDRERRLLYELLPERVADELLDRGEVTPRVVDATVVFLDVVGFSAAARKVRPVVLLETLDRLFSAFDAVVERNGLVTLKTIGDGYLMAGGLFAEHAQLEDALRAALALVAASEAHSGALGAGLRVRVGVHVGPVVAGVIGRKRPSFDIWGDTVNVAARVEQLGEAGAVVVSEAVAQRLPPPFSVEDIGVRTAKHGVQLHLYRLRPRG